MPCVQPHIPPLVEVVVGTAEDVVAEVVVGEAV